MDEKKPETYDCNAEYLRWLDSACDDEIVSQLKQMKDNPSLITESFYTDLSFGTAGLRGIIGAGTNRMNRYVVRRASAGLAKYLLTYKSAKEHGVAIAYDSRNYSKEFALETALTIAAFGIKCFLYSTLHSVPQLSFAVRELGCIAGVVITASHNPPEYNGYKVYWSNGCQVAPKQADAIFENIKETDYFSVQPLSYQDAVDRGLVISVGEQLDELYYKRIMSFVLRPEFIKAHGSDISIVYSPLHGSGLTPVTTVLNRMGISKVYVVEEQAQPDGRFPTVKAPNPEDPKAFALGKVLADRVGADIILATDPDADRLGAAVRSPDGFVTLTGNQIACILLEYILKTRKELHTLPENAFAVKSVVSTSLADAICADYNVELKNVLTGFRFIGEMIDKLQCENKVFVFGFEESFGFLAGDHVRDKDAVCAAALIAEAAIYYASFGKTLYDVLNDIYEKYGYYMEKTVSYSLSGKEGMERIAFAMSSLRANPPSAFEGEKVIAFEDMKFAVHHDCINNVCSKLDYPRSDVLRFLLPDCAWLIVRPSGTEPKLKLYCGVMQQDARMSKQRLDKLLNAADNLLSSYLK